MIWRKWTCRENGAIDSSYGPSLAVAIGTRIPIKCKADHLDSLNTQPPLLWGNKEAISVTWEDSTALICGGKSTALREVSLTKVLISPTSLDRHLLGERERAGRDGPKDRGIFLLTVCPTSLSHLLLLIWVVLSKKHLSFLCWPTNIHSNSIQID